MTLRLKSTNLTFVKMQNLAQNVFADFQAGTLRIGKHSVDVDLTSSARPRTSHLFSKIDVVGRPCPCMSGSGRSFRGTSSWAVLWRHIGRNKGYFLIKTYCSISITCVHTTSHSLHTLNAAVQLIPRIFEADKIRSFMLEISSHSVNVILKSDEILNFVNFALI